MELRTLAQFKKLHQLSSKRTLVLPEEEFFASLDSIRSKIESSTD